MKLVWVLILFIYCPVTFATDAVEIPRSETVELTDPASKLIYPVFIKAPRSYRSNTNKVYPVVYLTDGMYSFQIASGATRFPMNSGAMEEAFIVSLSYSKGANGASSRIRDYTPSRADDWKLPTGNAEGHALFIREVVFPYMADNYRVSATERTYVGNSLGGLFGAYILFKHPTMFSSYVLGSPSVWFNNHDLLSLKPTESRSPIKVYISVGSLERPQFGEKQNMVAGATKLKNKIVTEAGGSVTLKFNIIEDAKHATAFPTTLIQGLDWIYGKPKVEQR
ncbi:alpha/beta hydrolase [Pseudidiomarina gelatinasegens]|uniref:Alpha/beta hydrolase n=1 Tax=Pseudidiomarina gelatinasegens TaxID=2487740 RepID=A0A443YVK2_9GAMM|nr:alpha/beta hydrolase-fold protein [Pseudidiomarina gelatinasegens]RWU08008.1 alpha/beta hydrolase [Pseudidiomarina gelatinasegens]